MQPSLVGLLVVAAVYLIDRRLDGRLVVGLLISLTFGATAFAVLTAVGGSSPLIYTLFAIFLTVAFALRRDFSGAFRRVLAIHPVGWVIVLLVAYVVAGSVILPRLYAGETIVYVIQRTASGAGAVVAAPLAPNNGNFTQAAYFALAALMYFVVLALATDPKGLKRIRYAAMAWMVAVIATGYADILGKLLGLGDILAPIRTASYSMMTGEEHAIAGLPRVNGAFSEASAFAAVSVPACVFAISYWRLTRQTIFLVCAALAFGLVLLSTSTTAYAALGICGLWLGLTSLWRLASGRIRVVDGLLFLAGCLALAVLLGAYLYDDRPFAPFVRMFELMVLEKGTSSSAAERGMWNAVAFQALIDTNGLGVGIGSTRTSSWLVAVLSHFGWLGGGAMLATLVLLVRGHGGLAHGGLAVSREHREAYAVSVSCRAAALAGVIAASVSSASSDPGVFYFFALATLVATRHAIAGLDPRRTPAAVPFGWPDDAIAVRPPSHPSSPAR